jgi:hypothetical protein
LAEVQQDSLPDLTLAPQLLPSVPRMMPLLLLFLLQEVHAPLNNGLLNWPYSDENSKSSSNPQVLCKWLLVHSVLRQRVMSLGWEEELGEEPLVMIRLEALKY